MRAACTLEMRAVLSQHWDARAPHACFFATRDIAAGEPLTYLRDQAVLTAKQVFSRPAGGEGGGGDHAPRDERSGLKAIRCLCGHPGCRGWA